MMDTFSIRKQNDVTKRIKSHKILQENESSFRYTAHEKIILFVGTNFWQQGFISRIEIVPEFNFSKKKCLVKRLGGNYFRSLEKQAVF